MDIAFCALIAGESVSFSRTKIASLAARLMFLGTEESSDICLRRCLD